MSRLTKRGRLVLIYIPAAIALLALIVWVSGHVWYVPGEGYCIGTMTECFREAFTR
jgi:hypothetical protein